MGQCPPEESGKLQGEAWRVGDRTYFPTAWLRGHLWEPAFTASARGMSARKSFPHREAVLPQSTHCTVTGVNWPLVSVRAALICLLNPCDYMMLLHGNPNCPDLNLNKSTFENPDQCLFREKIKVFSAGESGANPRPATSLLHRP